jgi:hypothetical protein
MTLSSLSFCSSSLGTFVMGSSTMISPFEESLVLAAPALVVAVLLVLVKVAFPSCITAVTHNMLENK